MIMTYICVGFIVLVAVITALIMTCRSGSIDTVSGTVLALFIATVIAVPTCSIVSDGIQRNHRVTEHQIVEQPLMCISDISSNSSEFSGMFILGCGGVSGSTSTITKYAGYIATDDGEYIRMEWDASKTYISFGDDTPCVKYHWEMTKNTVDWAWGAGGHWNSIEKTVLHIPEGSVYREYKIDMQ